MNTPKPGRTRKARAARTLTAAEQFFFTHAGFSHDPKTETAEQGRMRCARELAAAEAKAQGMGYTFEWSDDWSIGSHIEEYGQGSVYHDEQTEPQTCEACVCRDSAGRIVASLHCIDDADAAYRRVVEAELAEEALDVLQSQIDREDVH